MGNHHARDKKLVCEETFKFCKRERTGKQDIFLTICILLCFLIKLSFAITEQGKQQNLDHKTTVIFAPFPDSDRAFQVVLVIKNLPANEGNIRNTGSIPGLGRSPGEVHGNPVQYFCLENPHG